MKIRTTVRGLVRRFRGRNCYLHLHWVSPAIFWDIWQRKFFLRTDSARKAATVGVVWKKKCA